MKKKKSHCWKFRVCIATPPFGPAHLSVQESSRSAKKVANTLPKMGAIPIASELTKFRLARKAVARPWGASLRPMFPEARFTPAVATPIKM